MPITLPENFKLDYQTVAFIKHLMSGKFMNIKHGVQMLSEGKTHYSYNGSPVIDSLLRDSKALPDILNELIELAD
jgi:hypothetical protein